ncbi:unnamed protein product, partial [Medioppia subpectinata]
AVKDAIEIGYRHIDTASDYGNEAEVGQAIAESIKAGIIKREDLFVTTKVWPQKADAQAKALQSIHESLTKMNLTYLDLVLVHFPWDDYVGSYKGCEDAFHQKLVRSIGISNFNEQQTDNLVSKATVKPANDQIMSNPKAESAGYLKYSHSHNITVTAYSPLGTGSLVKNPKLMAIGQKHNKSAAQVMIRWQIQRGVIVIPKSVKKQYIKEDFEQYIGHKIMGFIDKVCESNSETDFETERQKLTPMIKLNTGYEMPEIGLGTWQAKGDPVKQAVKDALEVGYRHIDTAYIYENEKEVGEGIHAQIAAGVLKREELFITTKVWPNGSNQKKALEMIHHSLKQLNVTYLDLVLI